MKRRIAEKIGLKKEYKILNEKNVKRALALLMAVAAMALSYMKMGIFFETNDDRLITEILSGAMTQAHSAFIDLMSCFLSVPLYWLYQITGGMIPWYGGSLILFHVISYTVIFAAFLGLCSRKIDTLAGISLCASFFLINLYCIGQIQWTSTAALLALAGYVFLLAKENRKSVLGFAGLELMAFFLRDAAMLMVQPLGAAVLLAQLLGGGKWKEKKQWNMILSWGLSLAGIFVIGMLGKGVEHYAIGWQDDGRYYTAWVALQDYYEFPPYEEVKDILDKYQVKRAEYEGMANYVMLDSSIGTDCLIELAEYASEVQGEKDIKWTEALKLSFCNLIKEESRATNRLAGLCWIFVLVSLLLLRKKAFLLEAAGLAAARTIVWCYLIYRGRLPDRVTFPLYYAEIVLLWLMMLKAYLEMKNRLLWRRMIFWCMAAVMVVCSYRIGQRQYRYVFRVNDVQEIYIQGLRDVKEYCNQNPDNRYILDAFSFKYYRGSALETDIYKPSNGIYSGTWNSRTMIEKRYEKEYMDGHWNDFYLIVYDDGQALEEQRNYISVRCYEEKTGLQPDLYERITVSHGGVYLIWHFKGEKADE